MLFAGGVAQAAYMDRVEGEAADRCLVVPFDVGKDTAMVLVADHVGRSGRGPLTRPARPAGRSGRPQPGREDQGVSHQASTQNHGIRDELSLTDARLIVKANSGQRDF